MADDEITTYCSVRHDAYTTCSECINKPLPPIPDDVNAVTRVILRATRGQMALTHAHGLAVAAVRAVDEVRSKADSSDTLADRLDRMNQYGPLERRAIRHEAAAALRELTAEIARRDADRERRMHTRQDGSLKIAYETEAEAVATIKPTNWHRAYLCHDCNKWHTGKPPYEEMYERATKAEAALLSLRQPAQPEFCYDCKLEHVPGTTCPQPEPCVHGETKPHTFWCNAILSSPPCVEGSNRGHECNGRPK